VAGEHFASFASLETARTWPWSVRIGLKYRALARVRDDTAYWFWIGTHNEFDNIIGQFISGR
jgi:hypothetical protein